MPKEMIAVFSDEAYAALKSGVAVDNNGFRSKNGYYYPDQPTFKDIKLDNAQTIGLAGFAAAYVTVKIVLPMAKRFADEKLYPFLAESWDTWREKTKQKKEKANTKAHEDNQEVSEKQAESDNVIYLNKYRKEA